LTPTDPDDALFKGKECNENMYKIPSGTPSDVEMWDLMYTNIAFKNWYDNESKYDYAKY
jgi:hypothetical protein